MMKKSLILPIFAAALALGSCNSDDVRVFDESAADRLENSKQNNFDMLCADGGKWAMEYFANTDEPGYLFVMEFRPDKSVTITSDHKWIDNKETAETSMWDVITDNGVVLTFNTYNKVFHVFSDPANITGPNAPKDSNGQDEDETGYGHEGDYEFMIMSHESTDSRIRLRGKKHALSAYLVRLDADTDVSAYLAHAKKLRSQFDAKRFPTYVMTETATGETYEVTGLAAGVVSVLPAGSTNPFAQTESKACIITEKGMRPYVPFQFIRKDNSLFSVSEFTWSENGLVAPGVCITAPFGPDNLVRQDLTWNIDVDSFSPYLAGKFAEANEQSKQISIKGFGTNPTLSNLAFLFKNYKGKLTFNVQAKLGTVRFNYYGSVSAVDNHIANIELTIHDDAIKKDILREAPKVVEFLELLSGELEVTNKSVIDPSEMRFISKSNPDIYFSATVK